MIAAGEIITKIYAYRSSYVLIYGNIYIKLALTNVKNFMDNRFGPRTSDFGQVITILKN